MEKLWYAKGTVEREEFKRQYRQQPACRRFAKEKSTRVRVLVKRSEIASLRQSSENTRERCTTRVESKRPRHGEKVAPRRILRSGFTAHTLHYIGGRGVHGRGTRRHCTAVKCILSLAHLWPLSGSQCARSWYLLFSRCNVASTSDYFPPLSSTSHPGIFRRDRLFFLSSLSLFFLSLFVAFSLRSPHRVVPMSNSSFTFMAIVARRSLVPAPNRLSNLLWRCLKSQGFFQADEILLTPSCLPRVSLVFQRYAYSEFIFLACDCFLHVEFLNFCSISLTINSTFRRYLHKYQAYN